MPDKPNAGDATGIVPTPATRGARGWCKKSDVLVIADGRHANGGEGR